MFRVIHNTAAVYSLFGRTFQAPEIDEICVGSNTMSFQDYLDCRHFDLTVELFYNDGVFSELQAFLKQQGISAAALIARLDRSITDNPQLAGLYAGFMADTRELWQTREELEEFLRQPGVLERYRSGELGRNEQLAYKGLALFEMMDEVVAHAYRGAADLLREAGRLDTSVADYLDQLKLFDLLRKGAPQSVVETRTGRFHYDFCALGESGFREAPWSYRLDAPESVIFSHSAKQRQLMTESVHLLQIGLHGYAAMIGSNARVNEFFREYSRTDHTSHG
jgi:hypothetical protein